MPARYCDINLVRDADTCLITAWAASPALAIRYDKAEIEPIADRHAMLGKRPAPIV